MADTLFEESRADGGATDAITIEEGGAGEQRTGGTAAEQSGAVGREALLASAVATR